MKERILSCLPGNGNEKISKYCPIQSRKRLSDSIWVEIHRDTPVFGMVTTAGLFSLQHPWDDHSITWDVCINDVDRFSGIIKNGSVVGCFDHAPHLQTWLQRTMGDPNLIASECRCTWSRVHDARVDLKCVGGVIWSNFASVSLSETWKKSSNRWTSESFLCIKGFSTPQPRAWREGRRWSVESVPVGGKVRYWIVNAWRWLGGVRLATKLEVVSEYDPCPFLLYARYVMQWDHLSANSTGGISRFVDRKCMFKQSRSPKSVFQW